MSNLCINTLNAEGTPKQVDEFIRQMSETFGDDLDINDKFVVEEIAVASLMVNSSWQMPKKELLEVTSSLPDTNGLYIQMTSVEPAEEYLEQSVFCDGKWSFENPPSINAQIHALTVQGLEQIRQQIREKGNIDLGENCTWVALYINDDGYAECPYFQRVELEDNGKLTVLLSDRHWLYEDDLTTIHVMDLLTLLFEEHGKEKE